MANFSGKISFSAGFPGLGNNVGQVVQIVNIPSALTNNAKALRLSGEITQINQNTNTVRIETAQGDVEVQAPTKNLRKGQRVSIEIPSGQSPKQARVAFETPSRVTPNNQPVPNTSQQNVTIQNSSGQSSQVVTRPTQQPYQPAVQQNPQSNGRLPPVTENLPQTVARLTTAVTEEIAAQIAKVLKQAPQVIKPDTVVKILSATQAQAQTIIQQTVQTLPPALQQTLQPNIITVQNIPQLVTVNPAVQNIITPTPQSLLVQNVTQALLQPQAQNITPILSLVPATNNSANNLQPTLPNTQIITTQQALQPQQITAALQTIVGNNVPQNTAPQTTITPSTESTAAPLKTTIQPILFDPTRPQPIQTISTGKIEIQIASITSPDVKIVPVVNTQAAIPQASVTNLTPPAPALATANNASLLPAQVVGFTPRGLPLIVTQFPGNTTPQHFIMQIKGTNLQIGSQLQISQNGSLPVTPTAVVRSNPLLMGFQWPALDDLYNVLQQLNPQIASSLTRSLPNAGNPAQISAAAMTFIAAVKSGDLASFLGERKIDLIRQAGRDNILSRLTQSDAGRAANVEATSSGDWRAVPLPMFWEGEIHRIMLYTRQENFDGQNDQENENGQTRFVFDLSLSKMGNVQIDGFLKDERLDLIVRTQRGFSEPMQQTMRRAYTDALDQTSLSGDLNFQGSTDHWVSVQQETEAFGAHI